MPRTRGKRASKSSPKKAAAAEDETVDSGAAVPEESPSVEQSTNENMMESEDVQASTENVDDAAAQSEEVEPKVKTESTVPDEKMETEEQGTKEEKKTEPPVEEPKEPVYKPHTIPSFTNKALIEKWEWHMRVYPIDQADIRSCVLESVSKIAQETWMFIDNQNYGMGAYDLCIKSASDAATIVLKTLAMPLTYRYLTIKVTRRGKNAAEVRKINKRREAMTEDENDLDEELDNLPYSEAVEKATLLLDYTQTYVLNKVKGQEKKRNLYVKYLPEGTSKELLKVLFPVANNLDIIKTAKGRRVGELNVSTIPNILGICNSYVTTHINGRRNITLDWKEENIEDNRLVQESYAELPWEIIPRDFEYPYETIPYIEQDDVNEYGRKRKREENQKQDRERGRDRDGDRFGGGGGGGRRRDRMRDMPPGVDDVLRMQQEMNERISSQVALLTAVGDAAHFDGPPPLMGLPPVYPGPPPPPPGPGFRRDRRDDRRGGRGGDRERRNSSGGRGGDPTKDKKDADKPKVKKDEKKSRWDKSDADDGAEKGPAADKSAVRDSKSPGSGRRFDGNRFGSPAGQGNWGGDDGRWGRFDEPMRGFGNRRGGGRFDDSRRGGGRFDGRGGGHFDDSQRGRRFDQGGRGGGGHYDEFGRGGRFGDRGPGRFDGDGRPGMMGEGPGMMGEGPGMMGQGPGMMGQGPGLMGDGPGMDNMGRGGRFDRGGRGGNKRGGGGFGQGNNFNMGNRGNQMMGGNNQGYGYSQGDGDQSGNMGNMQNQQGGFGNQMSGGYGNQSDRSGGYMNQGGNQSSDQYGMSGQSGGFGNQNNRGFGNQSGSFGNQQNQSGYNNQSGNYGNQQNQSGGGFGNQAKQSSGFGVQAKQTGNYGNQSNQTSSGSFAYSTQNAMGMNQGGYGGTQDTKTSGTTAGVQTGIKAQSSFTSKTQGFGNQSTDAGLNVQKTTVTPKAQPQTQQNIGNMATQNQQNMAMGQTSYGSQQSGYNQGSYGTQNYGTYDDSSYQQNYMGQQQLYGGYSTADNGGAWSQPAGDFSQYGTQSQGTMNQSSYSTSNTMGQTDSYNTSSYNTQAAGYSADAAFANQGFYAAPQSSTGNMAYGEYSTQDTTAAYATGNTTNLANMATYNFASYNTGS